MHSYIYVFIYLYIHVLIYSYIYIQKERQSLADIEMEQLRIDPEVRSIQWGKDLKQEGTKKRMDKDSVRKVAKKIEEKNEEIAEKIELTAKIFLPFTYFIFNIFYWVRYMKSEEGGEIEIASVY